MIRIENVTVFDSRAGENTGPYDVEVAEGTIRALRPPAAARPTDPAVESVIDGTGRTLIPGLIDAHWHAAFAAIAPSAVLSGDAGYLFATAVVGARHTLQRGFTTVRDLGGPTHGLKRAIDEGVTPGPRIFPSGAFISQSGGHGDFRMPHEVPRGVAGHLSHSEMAGAAVIADGEAEVLRASREVLRQGASQLKLMAGGGVASHYDPLDVSQYTVAEMRAAVSAAENWGTYVTVHAYTPRAIRTAVEAGVRCIEHGHLIDEETAALLAEHDVWWCLQPFLDDEDAVPMTGPNKRKQQEMVAGTDRAYQLAIDHGIKVAFGTDTLFDARLATRQGAQLAKLTRWYTPAQALQQATFRNAELLRLCGRRNPYPGALGVVEEGALADLVLVDGDPLEDISLLARPDEAFAMIMKDGRVVDRG
ncbi:hydrolase [Brachybacterium sp. P6-10-X1]|uniref:metal-dependent hydrolase family protein n=1 Tax=Brachybacterium sp. P6-10-X1 TaxID=1903186 RepID=UPI000971B230|nr:amidohydrolase family protein [Brachybacterium sp. P6-10-X1]APX34870.1 hydrolase [Brachybacterium sp. P6-10-X1]